MTQLYQKKAIPTEAHQWWKNGDHPDDGCADGHEGDDEACEGKVVRFFRRPEPGYASDVTHDQCGRTWHDHGWIDTLEGGHTVCPGSWIVTGVEGERWPVKDSIFQATYEKVPAEGEFEKRIADAIRASREYQEGMARGVPKNVREQYLSGISSAAARALA
ncbi:hypothetical protein KIH74_22585 [Kineosporia sp. J2-2]|uniref:Uncharacterized protein n=1 Tax=Kineosporia corallincola TaxID=2835133 RepID=A0ABS5TL58_9ACTN|nr:hypothetical protein [Kineosporia corallincola]MBT0771745.1 hypothetical protein [Kineosporia corallincola]